MIKLRKLSCSFCGKNESAVAKLVAGPRVYICDECVAIASRMMEDGDSNDPPRTQVKSSRHNLLARVRRLWHADSQRVRNANC